MKQRGLYYNDLALVDGYGEGDLITLAVIPRFRDTKSKKRGVGRTQQALLSLDTLQRFPIMDGIYKYRRRRFHPTGVELLVAPSVHAVTVEIKPREAELRLFELSNFNPLVIRETYYTIARHFWGAGDRVQIWAGDCKGMKGILYDINWQNESATVDMLESPAPTRPIMLEVPIQEIERIFVEGDHVRVVVGLMKGKMGTIVSVTGEHVTILEDRPPPTSLASTRAIEEAMSEVNVLR